MTKFWNNSRTIFLVYCCIFLALPAFSNSKESSTQKLTEKHLISSALKNYPKILSYYEKIAVKEGGVLEKEGYFDIKLNQKYQGKIDGYYDGKELDTFIEKQNSFLGSKIYGGYRKSYGDYADYDGAIRTNSGGEYRAGASFSLLRNRAIDKGRLDLITSRLELQESKIQLENIKIEIQRDAAKSYWSWVIAGEIYKIYQQLYELALKRNEQLKIRLKKGDIAEIVLIENERNILNRKSSMLEAKRSFENNGIYLSLFFRNIDGNPQIPQLEELPDNKFSPIEISDGKKQKDVEHALEMRPELRIIKIQKEQEISHLNQGKNLLKPRLDVAVETSKDLGSGPISRAQTNNSVKLDFQIPFQQREAKGKIASSESKLDALRFEEKLLCESIAAEIAQIQNLVNNSVEIYQNLERELQLSKKLEQAEKDRFKQGGSDFFLINLREQEVATATISQLRIFEKYQNLQAQYRTLVFELIN